MRWWGWGEDSRAVQLGDGAAAFLCAELGLRDGAASPPVALEDVRLAEAAGAV